MSPSPARVLLVANTSWYLYNFRLPLLRDLRAAGYHVAAVAPADAYTERLEAEGIRFRTDGSVDLAVYGWAPDPGGGGSGSASDPTPPDD